jgi:SAM-dependent methyltransferase
MATRDTHGLGYHRVDADPNVDVLLATMDGTAGWDATLRLRSWERAHLGLAPGERLLDVGCGLGEAALGLAQDLGEGGEVVGVDASERMLRVARSSAAAARCRVRFTLGDACSLDEPDDAFDAVRCERTLQWIDDPAAAVAEMARVVRPGGRISLIDTDWSTFTLDVGDEALAALVRDGMRTERNRPSNVGRRLHELVGATGCVTLARTEATRTWTTWDPGESPAPLGCFSMESLADDLAATGRLATDDRLRFVSTIHEAARRGRFSMSLTMFGVVAQAP